MLNLITKFCFMPISVGGGINNFDLVKKILSKGADKVVINSNLRFDLIKKISGDVWSTIYNCKYRFKKSF